MEIFEYYRGYGVLYNSMNGITFVQESGCTLHYITGGIKGIKLAKEYINKELYNGD